MSAGAVPAVSAADVLGIASRAWGVLAGDPALPARVPPDPVPAGAVRAWVGIEGPWRGRVQLVCGPGAAARMAAAVTGDAPGQVAAEDVEDVLGELANVVGGGVKARLPGSAALGLPAVGPDDRGRDGPPLLRVDLLWRDEPVVVTLHPPAPAPPPARPDPADHATARGETP